MSALVGAYRFLTGSFIGVFLADGAILFIDLFKAVFLVAVFLLFVTFEAPIFWWDL